MVWDNIDSKNKNDNKNNNNNNKNNFQRINNRIPKCSN